jgi:hypothetical protein
MYMAEGKEGEVKIAGICTIDNISIRNCQIIIKVNHLSEVYG